MKKSIEDVLKDHTRQLMNIPGVTGTGQGLCNGAPCIKVFTADLPEDSRVRIPSELEGYSVRIEQSGPFQAYE